VRVVYFMIIIAPVYTFGLQNGFFWGGRYTHQFYLTRIDSLNYGDKVYKGIQNECKIEAFAGIDFNDNSGTVFTLLAYNPIFNWWEFWLGATVTAFHFKLFSGRK
jgi:hypothetical protein